LRKAWCCMPTRVQKSLEPLHFGWSLVPSNLEHCSWLIYHHKLDEPAKIDLESSASSQALRAKRSRPGQNNRRVGPFCPQLAKNGSK
jgi:hypothetical protein